MEIPLLRPVDYTDPTGHFSISKVFDKRGDFFEDNWEYVASAAIVVATSFAVIATGGTASPFMPMVIGEAIGGLTGAISAHRHGGDVGRGMLVGAGVGGATAMTAMGFKDYMLNTVFADKLITPFQGGMITAVEFGIGGFGTGLIEGYAGGARSWSDAFRHAGISAGFGAALGFAAGYSYTAGWQNFLHGADTQAHNKSLLQRMKTSLKVGFENMVEKYMNYRDRMDLFWESKTGKFLEKGIESTFGAIEGGFSLNDPICESVYKDYMYRRKLFESVRIQEYWERA